MNIRHLIDIIIQRDDVVDNFIIGLTGAFGSGCSFIADNFISKKFEFIKYSLSDILKEEYIKGNVSEYSRHELQDFGNELRKTNGPDYLAKALLEKFRIDGWDNSQNIVIDSFRNPAEVEYVRQHCANFFLVAIFADKDVRWNRVANNYKNKYDQFNEDENKDQGANEPDYGQKVSNCFFQADLILSNNEYINIEYPNTAYKEMFGKINNYLTAFKNPESSHPTISETLMAIAYTNGRRSKCSKRKVGAIIVDTYNNILSSGFNDVPIDFDDCIGKYGRCYRDYFRSNLIAEYATMVNGDTELAKKIVDKTKVLELCRALHAEENSILNLRSSSRTDFTDCTLYATTYPCNLCANKIVQTGIKNVVYFEPYPVAQAKEIFREGGVIAIPFEGVTFRSFFKAFTFETD